MGWTDPRKLADKNEWFDANLDHEGPACYELGTGGPRGGGIQWHYVGETKNEKQRMTKYGRDGSHLSKIINRHLRDGWCIWYRATACATKEDAKRMQDNLLSRNKYDWNIILNQQD
ncbi:MAG TPA: hypothetical protein VEF06_11025 [Bryobacteraceae bacterium]|nr:hypothetical protein [Bryobacteraceae bacterium]